MGEAHPGEISRRYKDARRHLQSFQYRWVITGVAGFIGSNLLQALLDLNQRVVGLDNLSTGYRHNLEQVEDAVGKQAWSNFTFIEGDIREQSDCRQACHDAEFVLHQAALGSVSRSIEDPFGTNENNITGFLNMLVAARDMKVHRFIYAASSSTYGDHPGLPKIESEIGRPLSPYAVTKYVNELYADVFHRCYATESIGLRYFNVFGPRQDPDGAYAAVIPRWIAAMIRNATVCINGDGETSRDFCFVENVIQANILATLSRDPESVNQIYNIALNDRMTLNELYETVRALLVEDYPHVKYHRPLYGKFRDGDIRHSQADISKAVRLLGYSPTHRVPEGLSQSMNWYRHSFACAQV